MKTPKPSKAELLEYINTNIGRLLAIQRQLKERKQLMSDLSLDFSLDLEGDDLARYSTTEANVDDVLESLKQMRDLVEKGIRYPTI